MLLKKRNIDLLDNLNSNDTNAVHCLWCVSDLDIELCIRLLPCLFREDASYIYAPDGQVFYQVFYILCKLLPKVTNSMNSIVLFSA